MTVRWRRPPARALATGAAAAVLAATALAPALAQADPGALDATFGTGGRRTLNFGGTDRATHVAITPDGRIVSVGSTDATGSGDFAVARLKADGTPDDTFGSGGTTSVGTAANVNDIGGGIAVLPNEQLVVSGQGNATQDFVTKRLNADGTVDGGFAGGTGTSTIDFGGNDAVNAMLRQPDGKLVLVGSTTGAGGNDMAVARLNPDGTPDTSFSDDGEQTVDFGGTDTANAVALAAGGKIVLAGQGGPASDMVVTRLNADGTVDGSFAPATTGKASVDFGGTDGANGVAIQSDGKLVLGGVTNAVGSGDVAVARLDAGGALDASFSDDGKLTLGYAAANEVGLALALQANGRILSFAQGGPGNDFQLTRLAPDGSTDASFATSGTAAIDFGGAEFDGDVAVQPDGQIVTVGSTNATDGGDEAFARVDGDPATLPPSEPPPNFSLRFAPDKYRQPFPVAPGQKRTVGIIVQRNATSVGKISLTVRKVKGLTGEVRPAVLSGRGTQRTTLTLTAGARPVYVKNGLVTGSGVATAGAEPRRLPFRALVQGQLAVWLTGLQVTQGVQTYSQPRFRRYRGVQLVRGKKTVVRVFVDFEGTRPARAVRAKLFPPLTVALSGTFAGRRLPGSPLLPSWSPPQTAYRFNAGGLSNQAMESSTSAFTFVLPPKWTQVPINLSAQAYAPRPSTYTARSRPEPLASTLCTAPSCGARSASVTAVNFAAPPKPRVISVIKVRYLRGGKYTGDVPPAAGPLATAAALSPVPFVYLNGAGELRPYADFAGMVTVSAAEDADARRIVQDKIAKYDIANHSPGDDMVGLFTVGGGGGWANGRDASADVEPDLVAAHEIGHLLGLGHADTACGGSDTATGFPDHDGRLRSVGIDTTEGSDGAGARAGPYQVIPDDPPDNGGWDVMSYCPKGGGAHWISAHNWSALLGVPTPSGRREMAKPRTGSFLVLRGRESAGRVGIDSVSPATVSTAAGTPSVYRLVGRNAAGAVVADVPLTARSTHEDGASVVPPFTSLEGYVPAAGVARLEVAREGAVLASVARSAATPSARLLTPVRGARLNGARGVTLRWSAADADGDVPDVSLEYSADGGKTYRTVVQGAGGGRVTLPRNLLASSTGGRLRLRATDGFNTTVTAARPIVVLARKPSVRILEPRSHERVQGGAALYLRGAGVDDHGRNLSGQRLRWYAGRKLLGTGATLSAVLPAGTRSVRLVARDRAGRAGSASVGVRVQATTPLFLRLTAPAKLSRRARTLTLRVASTVPATLRLGSQHHAVGRKARRVRFKVRRGRSTLRLRLVLRSGSRGSAQYVLVPRR